MSMQHVEHMKASLARLAKEAGLTVQELDAQLQARADRQRVEREAREEAKRAQAAEALAFVGGITDEHGLPAAYAVARELTQRHLGGRPVKLVALLLEAGLATTAVKPPGSAGHRWGRTWRLNCTRSSGRARGAARGTCGCRRARAWKAWPTRWGGVGWG